MAPPADIPTTNTRCGSIVHRDASAIDGARRARDERGLAAAARLVLGREPVPAALRVVLAHLLGVGDDEAVAVRLLVEERARGKRRGRLGAPVERDDERGGRRRVEAVGDVDADGSRAAAVVVLDHVAGDRAIAAPSECPGRRSPGRETAGAGSRAAGPNAPGPGRRAGRAMATRSVVRSAGMVWPSMTSGSAGTLRPSMTARLAAYRSRQSMSSMRVLFQATDQYVNHSALRTPAGRHEAAVDAEQRDALRLRQRGVADDRGLRVRTSVACAPSSSAGDSSPARARRSPSGTSSAAAIAARTERDGSCRPRSIWLR